jgi:PE-PPE domain
MSGRKLRWLGLGLVATGGTSILTLTATMNSAFAYADDIGLVIGGSGQPIPGAEYVEAADNLYLDNTSTSPPLTPDGPIYPDLTFYQATGTTGLSQYGEGLYTPEGAYPHDVHSLLYNYPTAADGFPDLSSSVGQGMTILESTIAADTAAGDTSTVFGYSQSATISSLVMEQLDPGGTNKANSGLDFLLIGDPNAPNGGLFERFNGFETTSGQTVSDPLNLPSLGWVLDGATPADDYTTSIFSLEYDGATDFPRYPLDFLSDLNAVLGIDEIHGNYLTDFTPQEIASDAFLLPGSEALGADTLTNYYMIDQTAPLVSLLPQPLQDLLGPDLTYLINLGYGDGTLGYSVTADSPANVPTPFGLFPDVSLSTVLSTLATDTEQGITAFEKDLADPAALLASLDPASSGQSLTDLWSALSADAADPAATLTNFVNALSIAASAAYSTLQPTADIINTLVTSVPAYDASLISDNLSSGDILDAFGLPIAANTALDTLVAGFEVDALETAATQISDAFSGLF